MWLAGQILPGVMLTPSSSGALIITSPALTTATTSALISRRVASTGLDSPLGHFPRMETSTSLGSPARISSVVPVLPTSFR